MVFGGKLRGHVKEPAVVSVEQEHVQSSPRTAQFGHRLQRLKRFNGTQSCSICLKVFFVLLGLMAVVLSLSLITLTVITSVETKAYDAETSSRLVAMVLLAVTGAITIAVVIYGEVAVFKKRPKPLHSSVVVLLVLVIIQALIAGIAVNISLRDEERLGNSLISSFAQSREANPRHLKLWTMTQYGLGCCGVVGPEDYREINVPIFFSPNVPISCCPSYDPDRSDLVQEKEREQCKAKRAYFDVGCNKVVISVFKETASMVISVTVGLIFVEIFLMIFGGMLSKRTKCSLEESNEN